MVEVGGGRGQLGRDILAYLQSDKPEVFRTCSYTIVEIAENLADLQRKSLHPWIASGHAQVICSDVMHWLAKDPAAASEAPSVCSRSNHSGVVHVIACEVLDNFPHDLIRVDGTHAMQAWVETTAVPLSRSSITWKTEIEPNVLEAMTAFFPDPQSGTWLDAIRSLTDYLLGGGSVDYWTPTDCFAFIRALVDRFAEHTITIADFTSIPGGLSGRNAPVVQRVDRGRDIVYDSVADAPFGHVDIMFPTNLVQLQRLYAQCTRNSSTESETRVLSSKEFFLQNTDEHDLIRSTCADGWNPIVSDFVNTGFFLTRSVRV